MAARASALVLVLFLLLPGCRACTSRPGGQSAVVPADPADPADLPAVDELPDPFALAGGGRVRSAADWSRRRAEIKELLQTYAYGHLPPPPGPILRTEELERVDQYGGRAVRRLLRLTFGPDGAISMLLGLIEPRPLEAGRRLPVIIHVDHRMTFGISAAEEIVGRGYLVVGFHPNVLDPDEPEVLGPAQAAYPRYDWATLAVWAWGAMRAVDYLLTLPEVDPRRIAITGHSRSGKAALLAGALDERIALVAPQGSGCAGASSYRFAPDGAERLADITRNFPHWFVPRLKGFAGKENRLPFDQHFLLALVAPRALLTIDAEGDVWAGPSGTQVSLLGARPVYEFLGAADKLGSFLRAGRHELTDDDWRTLLDFADRQFFGKPAARRFDRLPFTMARPTHRWRAPAR